ncbi:uncharacterized protein LOC117326495 [Pecten maximus]|uniref:uncharacterized protein LOC117326495 n=1 Tax=Pecten maximus TaxID=6579 RepID=UPI001457FF50|nr:uncharacterized protein LOC117326495 [Pecten maximus]
MEPSDEMQTLMEYLKESKSTFCFIHSEKEVSLFCKTCESEICTSCVIAGDHSNHTFCEIDDVVSEKRQKLGEWIEHSREEMISKIQQNMNEVKKEKENVMKNSKNLSMEIDNRKTDFSQRLESWSENQQLVVRTQQQKMLRRLNESLVESETSLAIMEHFRRNPQCGDCIGGTKLVQVLEMLENTTRDILDVDILDEWTFTTEMGNADKMGKWFGYVTGIDSEDSYQQAIKFKFCDSQISQISPIGAKKAFVVTEGHLYLVDSTQVKCTRADIEPLMTEVKYITPVTERGIYVQQTDSTVIKHITVDGQVHHFADFKSDQYYPSQSLRISHTGTVLSVKTANNHNSTGRQMLLNGYNNNGVKLKKSNIISYQYMAEPIYYVHTAADIYALITSDVIPTKTFQPGSVVNVATEESYVGTIGSQPASTFHPRGLCKDQDDHLIVSDFWNHAIHQLTSDGTFKKFLMTADDGLMNPTAVGIDNINWLWVAQSDGQIHIVKYDP